jgi:hypothetical protein
MKDEYFVEFVEATEWVKHASKYHHETVTVRELKIQANKLRRMIGKGLANFVSPPFTRSKVSKKKVRKLEGKVNRDIDQQYKKVLILAEKAICEKHVFEGNEPPKRAQAREMLKQIRDIVRTSAVIRLQKTLMNVRSAAQKAAMAHVTGTSISRLT